MSRGFAGCPAVVIVDDDIDHVVIVRRVLARLAPGLPVTAVIHANDLRSHIREAPSGALLLIDRRLGSADGLALLAEVCRERPDLRAALLSASLTPEEQARALACGAVLAADKPARLDDWRSLLRRLLDPAASHDAAA